MLGEIERIVSFGIRRPGYDEGLRTEQFILHRFNELGLGDTGSGELLATHDEALVHWRTGGGRSLFCCAVHRLDGE